MNKRFLQISLFLAVILFMTCSDPIFYSISEEVKPTEARIKGSPSNIVEFEDAMYVASGSTLWKYYEALDEETKTPIWIWGKETPPAAGRIIQLASTLTCLYALCFQENNNSKLMQFDGASWIEISGDIEKYNKAQFIFSANDKLFIGASKSVSEDDKNSYSVLYLDDLNITKDLNVKGRITGAAFNGTNYFISTQDDGIYMTSDPADSTKIKTIKLTNGDDLKSVVAMINVNTDKIAVITRRGNLHYLTDTDIGDSVASFGRRYASGCLAIWKENIEDEASDRLLLAGRQDRLSVGTDSGYTFGYLEVKFEVDAETGKVKNNSFTEPGRSSPSTVSDNSRYNSTIGVNPIKSLFQASDGTLFASTQVEGVWSYRYRNDGGWQWNAEE